MDTLYTIYNTLKHIWLCYMPAELHVKLKVCCHSFLYKPENNIDFFNALPSIAHSTEAIWPAALGPVYVFHPQYTLAGLLPELWPTANIPYI